jgi:hypothetical protein
MELGEWKPLECSDWNIQANVPTGTFVHARLGKYILDTPLLFIYNSLHERA